MCTSPDPVVLSLPACSINAVVDFVLLPVKNKLYDLLSRNLKQAKVFNSEFVTKQDIEIAEEKSLICFCNGKSDDSLDVLRHKRFCETVATKSVYVQPQSLLPTSAAAKYSFCVYFQIMKWKLSKKGMQPEEWGRKVLNGKLLPVMMDQSPAPENSL